MASKDCCAVYGRYLHYVSTDLGKGEPGRVGSNRSAILNKYFSHLCLLLAKPTSGILVFFQFACFVFVRVLGLRPRYSREALFYQNAVLEP